jgi:hypothetical protein
LQNLIARLHPARSSVYAGLPISGVLWPWEGRKQQGGWINEKIPQQQAAFFKNQPGSVAAGVLDLQRRPAHDDAQADDGRLQPRPKQKRLDFNELFV